MCSRTPSRKIRGLPPTSRSSVTSSSEPVSALLPSSHRTLPARSVAFDDAKGRQAFGHLSFLVFDERGHPGWVRFERKADAFDQRRFAGAAGTDNAGEATAELDRDRPPGSPTRWILSSGRCS